VVILTYLLTNSFSGYYPDIIGFLAVNTLEVLEELCKCQSRANCPASVVIFTYGMHHNVAVQCFDSQTVHCVTSLKVA